MIKLLFLLIFQVIESQDIQKAAQEELEIKTHENENIKVQMCYSAREFHINLSRLNILDF